MPCQRKREREREREREKRVLFSSVYNIIRHTKYNIEDRVRLATFIQTILNLHTIIIN